VVSQLNTHLTNHNLHSSHQSAYKEAFSTETPLCSLFNHLLWNMENGLVSALVALDLSAAFDTVDHQILNRILEINYGISGHALKWSTSYLQDRKMCVKIKTGLSDVKCFNYFVPQGSCLGPVLFKMYCSTIADFVNDEQSIGGYPDNHYLRDSFNTKIPGDENSCLH